MNKLYLECEERNFQIGTMDEDPETMDDLDDITGMSFSDFKEFSPIFLYRNPIDGSTEIDVCEDFSDVDIGHLIIVVYSNEHQNQTGWATENVYKTRRQAKEAQQEILVSEKQENIWEQEGNNIEAVEIICLPIED